MTLSKSNLISGITFLVLFLSSCQTPYNNRLPLKWEIADLKIITAPDQVPPTYDAVALYTRSVETDLQIRIDFLDLDIVPDNDIYLAFDTRPGGFDTLPVDTLVDFPWDILVVIPASSTPRIYHSMTKSGIGQMIEEGVPDLLPRTIRDPWNDFVIVNLNKSAIPETNYPYRLQIFITSPGAMEVVDRLGPVRSDNPPPDRVPILLAFWNVFPAVTPAQALRRWDGAHTGPHGERHGLNALLTSVRRTNIPVFLLDLKNPAYLSALEYIGGISPVQELVNQGLVFLPEILLSDDDWISSTPPLIASSAIKNLNNQTKAPVVGPSSSSELSFRSVELSREIGQGFGLGISNLLYCQKIPSYFPPGYSMIFTFSGEQQPFRWKTGLIFPITNPNGDRQPTNEGFSIEFRRAMLEQFASSIRQQPDVLVLGGSLPESTWGHPRAAEAALRYIAYHPWIQPLNAKDLQVYRDVNSRKDPKPEKFLRTASSTYVYTGNNTYRYTILKLVNDWTAFPKSRSDCQEDFDGNGQDDCVLSSDSILAIINPSGAALDFLFYRNNKEIHQVVTNFIHLLPISDLLIDSFSETEAVHRILPTSAFVSDSINSYSFQPYPYPGKITFRSHNNALEKTFILLSDGLHVEIDSDHHIRTQIPLMLNPWERFSPEWHQRYSSVKTESGWIWGIENGPQVEISSTASLSLTAFNESRFNQKSAEDPNFEYPRGHFLPFPLALIETMSDGGFSIDLHISIDQDPSSITSK